MFWNKKPPVYCKKCGKKLDTYVVEDNFDQMTGIAKRKYMVYLCPDIFAYLNGEHYVILDTVLGHTYKKIKI